MKPVPDFHRLSDNVVVWHGYDPGSNVDCSSTAFLGDDGMILVDPVQLEEQALERLEQVGKIVAIVLTSGNHQRGSREERERLGVQIYAPEGCGEDIVWDIALRPGDLVGGRMEVVSLVGGGPGEIALIGGGLAIFGDAVVHLGGKLEILPDKYCEDPARLRVSLRAALEHEFEVACFAHGPPVVDGPRGKMSALLA